MDHALFLAAVWSRWQAMTRSWTSSRGAAAEAVIAVAGRSCSSGAHAGLRAKEADAVGGQNHGHPTTRPGAVVNFHQAVAI